MPVEIDVYNNRVFTAPSPDEDPMGRKEFHLPVLSGELIDLGSLSPDELSKAVRDAHHGPIDKPTKDGTPAAYPKILQAIMPYQEIVRRKMAGKSKNSILRAADEANELLTENVTIPLTPELKDWLTNKGFTFYGDNGEPII